MHDKVANKWIETELKNNSRTVLLKICNISSKSQENSN